MVPPVKLYMTDSWPAASVPAISRIPAHITHATRIPRESFLSRMIPPQSGTPVDTARIANEVLARSANRERAQHPTDSYSLSRMKDFAISLFRRESDGPVSPFPSA